MNITLRLEGIPERIIDAMIKDGIASTKTEAIRIAILNYNEHYPLSKSKNTEEIEKPENKTLITGWKKYLEDEKEDEVWKKHL